MSRITYQFKFIAIGVCVILLLEWNVRYFTEYNYYFSPIIKNTATYTKALPITTDYLLKMTRKMVKTELKNYNFTQSGVNKLEDLLIEKGGTPIRSLIISTWRSGSSFLGELLNSVPSNFYNYEPLVKYGAFQLRDKRYGSNTSNVIKKMLQCNFSGMEEFYFQHLKRYSDQVNGIQINKRLWDKCSYDREVFCYSPDFVSKMCKLFPFQSMKTVRFRLLLAEPILEDNELNTKIVLLIRDPRAVLLSRKTFCYRRDCKNPQVVCGDMIRDYQAASKFVKKYPDKFMALRYEDFILNLDTATSQLLKFLRLARTSSVNHFLDTHTNCSDPEPFSTYKVSREIPFKWKRVMNFAEVNKIQRVRACQDAMSKWGYLQAYNSRHLYSADFYPLPYSFISEKRKEQNLSTLKTVSKDTMRRYQGRKKLV